MASGFWNAHGVIFIDYLEERRTITGTYYVALFGSIDRRNQEETATFEEEKNSSS